LADDGVSSYRDLIVWQKAMDLVDMIYHLSRIFPPSEDYRLTSQITRAAVSIPANIAEGQARSTRKDFANFLMMAKGSLNETETLLIVARRQEFVTEAAARPAFLLMTEVSKMLTVLRRKLVGTRDG
jgi:four helix bundle protein